MFEAAAALLLSAFVVVAAEVTANKDNTPWEKRMLR